MLVVNREPVIVNEGGEWVQALEVVETMWVANSGAASAPEDGESKTKRITVTKRF